MKKQECKVEVIFASKPDEIRKVLCKLIADKKKSRLK